MRKSYVRDLHRVPADEVLQNLSLDTTNDYCTYFYFYKTLAQNLYQKNPIKMKALVILSDQQLISLSMDGNSDASAVFVRRYKNSLYTSIYLPVKDKYLAEDFFQDTFVKIIDTLKNEKYNEEGKFLPWAMGIVHNLCIDHFRKTKRTLGIQTGSNSDIFDVPRFSEKRIDERIAQSETHGKLTKMVESLPHDQRKLLY
jgi:RNA polymerase sigma factor (sigma-70 family)